MKKFLKKTALLFCLAVFMTSCIASKRKCGLTQAHKTIKKAPAVTQNAYSAILKSKKG